MRQLRVAGRVDDLDLALSIPDEPVTVGTTVDGEIRVRDAGSGARLGRVYAGVFASCGDDWLVVSREQLTDSLMVAGESVAVPAPVTVPHWTPLSVGGTELELRLGSSPGDLTVGGERLVVEPCPLQRAVFDAVDDLGFERTAVSCVLDDAGVYGSAPGPVQEFAYDPIDGPFAGRLDELSVVMRPEGTELAVYLDVEREGGLFSELSDPERKERVTVEEGETRVAVAERVREALSRHV
jgi:sporulation-control protein spo0M